MRQVNPLSERSLTAGYGAALALIALLTIASHLTLGSVLAEHEGSAAIVNVSGRQRMLSQRIASLAAQYRMGSPTAKADLLQTIGQFEAAHHKLIAASTTEARAGESAEAFRKIYYGGDTPLDGEVAAYIDLARRVAAMPPDASTPGPELLRIFAEARAPLLSRLDQVVQSHQRNSETQLSWLEFLQRVTLCVVLMTLATEALVIFRPMVRRVTQYARELLWLASVDNLTGLLNRHSLFDRAAAELGRAQRYGRSTAVLMIDADHFKQVNDNHGHAGGDAALRALAQVLRDDLRISDVAARIGGEEFVVLLPETGQQAALVIAQHLRAAVDRLQVRFGNATIRLTVSVGVSATEGRTMEFSALLREADDALYLAKSGGRNKVVSSQGSPVGPVLAWAQQEQAAAGGNRAGQVT